MKFKKKILDSLKGKNKYNYDETIVSEDPFDIFYSDFPHTEEVDEEKASPKTKKIKDKNPDEKDSIKNKDEEKDSLKKSSIKENKKENLMKDSIKINKKDNLKKDSSKNKDEEEENVKKSSIKENKKDNLKKDSIKNKKDSLKKDRIDKEDIIKDDDFLTNLLKPKSHLKDPQIIIPEIINSLEFYSSKNIKLTPLEMFKFPHISDIKYEEGDIFKSLYSLFIRTLLLISKSKQDFIMKYKSDILIYKNDEMLVTKGLERLLKINDINYELQGDFLSIKNIDMKILVDYLVNEPFNSSYVLPFIMSRTRFINGIFYEVNIKKGQAPVKDNDMILYKYILEGPFYSQDYLEYFEYKYKKK
ncbi:uncharacterized protein VNE69_03061 [Vairimorpha necatrix]|uniref:Uncharacterized protein n=1 Tax=Vairimorpha necatrix TaxID=6039 RepID=A0AAX4JA64_9MICR